MAECVAGSRMQLLRMLGTLIVSGFAPVRPMPISQSKRDADLPTYALVNLTNRFTKRDCGKAQNRNLQFSLFNLLQHVARPCARAPNVVWTCHL